MAEQQNTPIIFLAFANERGNQARYLRELEKEYRYEIARICFSVLLAYQQSTSSRDAMPRW
ncbi:MAG: hypothetical protein GY801_30660 [bacterium]|nr:hypothetical protein [bacterium]